MENMYKIRFNLERGENYLKWEISKPNGEVSYLSPELYDITLYNSTLKNNSKSSNKIYNGANKFVCAWVECEDINVEYVSEYELTDEYEKISFNPKTKPYWFNGIGENIDGLFFEELKTNKNKIYEKVKIKSNGGGELIHQDQLNYG